MDNIFDVITSIVAENDVNRDELKRALDVLHDSYSIEQIKTINATLVDYDDVLYQCAYIQLYLSSHVNAVQKIFSEFWRQNDFVKDFFRQRSPSIRVCSIGGGPGTDIFGMNWFLNELVGNFTITGDVLELYPSWNDIFDDVTSKLQLVNLRNVNYKYFDFFSITCSPSDIEAISSSDVITIVKFVSAVSYNTKYAEIKMMTLLEKVKPGAIVFFVDNSGGGNLELMSMAATGANLERIHEIRHEEYCVSDEVAKAMKPAYRDDVGPQKRLLLSSSIWYKRGTTPQEV